MNQAPREQEENDQGILPRKDHLGKPVFMGTTEEELETNAEEGLSETEESEERVFLKPRERVSRSIPWLLMS